MFHLTLRELAAKKLRLLTTAIAVMLGVAFMAGTLVLTATISKTFDGLFADGYAGTDAYVRGTSQIDAEGHPAFGICRQGEARPGRLSACIKQAVGF